jgi:hypothetical protein
MRRGREHRAGGIHGRDCARAVVGLLVRVAVGDQSRLLERNKA